MRFSLLLSGPSYFCPIITEKHTGKRSKAYMRKSIPYFILLTLLWVSGVCYAQTIQQQVEDQIRQFHLDQAYRTAAKIDAPALRTYYQAKVQFLKHIASDDDAYMEPFLQAVKTAQDEASKLSEKDPLRGVFLAEMHLLRGSVRAMDNQILKSTLDLKSACNILDANRSRFPDNPEQKKLLGVFNVALGAIPRKFQWLSGIFCFRGDLESGIKMLEEASRKSTLLPDEAEVVLFFCEKNLLSRPEKALARAQSLTQRYPSSFPYHYLLISGKLELRNTDSALRIATDKEPAFRQDTALFFSPFWDYTRAKIHYFRLELTEADQYFTRFLLHAKGKTFLSDAVFRKGMCQALLGKTAEAQRIFRGMVEQQSSGFDEDEYAMSMAKRFATTPPTENEILLFKARNLFDGGYYKKASTLLFPLLKKEITLNPEDKTELFYRLGRIYQESKQWDYAELAYSQSILQNPDRNLWMKVYSMYYLGKIRAEKGDKDGAQKLFERALTFDGYFYQSGLEQKCKAGLHDLKAQP